MNTLEEQLAQVKKEQHETAKLLIRRDLALSRANEQLQALDASKSEFISIAAHQLRTPLSALKWIMHMLSTNEFKDDIERADFISKAAKSTDRMIALVNDLLEVDHLQSRKAQFVFTTIEINTLITAVISEVRELALNRNISLKVFIEKETKLNADSTKIHDLIQNLIENAIKYTKEGGTVTVTASTENDSVKIVVKDSGIGIPQSQRSKIFTKFFRATNAMKLETVGSGLGLFIAKQVVERHGGNIWFESVEGEGTSFFVLLPIGFTS